MQALTELVNVTAGYPGKVILRDISFSVNAGDFIGVIGPNGGGKTTLLKLILGIMKPAKGEIFYKGSKKRTVLKTGYMPQHMSFDNKFPITVEEVVLSGLQRKPGAFFINKERKSKAAGLLEWAGMGDLLRNPIAELSGGQMQRVFLCRSLISDPELLILDEPDTYVDNTFESELFNMLKELNSRMAIILVSHDTGMVSSFVKSIACVNETLHHHHSNIISREILEAYKCPIDLITHGNLPHRVLNSHDHD